MFLSFQYRIYPTTVQERTFLHFARELTFLWDYALADRRDSGFRDHRSVTYLDQQARLKDGRAGDPEGLGRVPYDMARECLQRLDLGYRAGFRRYREGKGRPGFPRFRSETSSFTYIPASRLCTLAPGARPRLHVPKVGEGEVRRHRDPPLRGIPKNVTIRNESRGRWFAILQYEIPTRPRRPPGTRSPRSEWTWGCTTSRCSPRGRSWTPLGSG